MAYLDDDDRRHVWAAFMSEMVPQQRAGMMTKTDFRAAINALDAWLADNATIINSIFPTAARTSLTNLEKIGIFAAVARRRFVKGVT